MKTIEELEKSINQLKVDIEKLKGKKTEWKPTIDQLYWTINLGRMRTHSYFWSNDNIDNNKLRQKLIFKTEEEAEEWLEYLVAKEKAMNVFPEKEWKNGNISKYHIYYNNIKKNFFIDTNSFVQYFNIPYFRTRESAEEFIDKYKEQIKRDMEICS